MTEPSPQADAQYIKGMSLGQQGRMAEALQAFLAAIKINPDFGDAWRMASECAGHLGHDELAAKASAEAVRLMPKSAKAWMRHGLALNAVMQDVEAVEAYRHAVKLDPSHIGARVNLCVSLKRIGRPAEAETVIREALAIAGQDMDVNENAEENYSILHWHLALLELAKGNLKDGFAHFRARFKGGTNWKRLSSAKPLWRGENLQGKTILITAEQGHGDMLMMARYLPMLKGLGANVICQTHPALTRYFSGLRGVDAAVSTEVALDEITYDFHAPIFDLPYRFKTEAGNIPAAVPYLPVPTPIETPESSKRKIGIVWSGQPQNPCDALRNLPLKKLGEIFALPACTFFNLTRERTESDAAFLAAHGVIDLASELHDFMDSARIIAQLDLVITCDTAAAHLAGGMGKPVGVALPFAPDWRWGYDREDSPWYPTLRLFRQQKRCEWSDVIERIKDAITECH